MKKPYGIPYEEAKHYYGNCGAYFQRIDFENGYAVSIVSHAHSYGGSRGDFELAVMNAENDQIVYDTPVTYDVLGHLDFAEVAEAVAKVKALPKRCWDCNPPAYSPMSLEDWERTTKQSAFKKLEEAFDKAQAQAKAEEESCPYCNFGILRKTIASMELMSPDGPVLVPDIHCEECDYCGNKSFDKKARQYIDRVINKE